MHASPTAWLNSIFKKTASFKIKSTDLSIVCIALIIRVDSKDNSGKLVIPPCVCLLWRQSPFCLDDVYFLVPEPSCYNYKSEAPASRVKLEYLGLHDYFTS